MRKLAVSIFTLLAPILALAQGAPVNFVPGSSGKFYALGQKETVISGANQKFCISPDGRYVISQRLLLPTKVLSDYVNGKMADPPKMVITIADSQTKKTVDYPIDNPQYLDFSHLSADSFFVTIPKPDHSGYDHYILNLSGKSKPVSLPAIGDFYQIISLRNSNQALLFQIKYGQEQSTQVHVSLINSNGEISKTWMNLNVLPVDPNQTASSNQLLVHRTTDDTLHYLNVQTGQLTTQTNQEDLFIAPEFETEEIAITHPDLGNQKLIAIAPFEITSREDLESKLPEELRDMPYPIIAIAPAEISFSRDNSAIFVNDSNGISRIPIMLADIEAIKNARIAAIQTETLSRAKQVGLAMMIYSSDYDDLLPPAKKWDENLWPYMKNTELTRDFNYMLNGEDISKIKDPANLVLGEIVTKYGKAVVYADSSVRWIKPIAPVQLSQVLKDRPRLIVDSMKPAIPKPLPTS